LLALTEVNDYCNQLNFLKIKLIWLKINRIFPEEEILKGLKTPVLPE